LSPFFVYSLFDNVLIALDMTSDSPIVNALLLCATFTASTK
jgi:hypothetical protein